MENTRRCPASGTRVLPIGIGCARRPLLKTLCREWTYAITTFAAIRVSSHSSSQREQKRAGMRTSYPASAMTRSGRFFRVDAM